MWSNGPVTDDVGMTTTRNQTGTTDQLADAKAYLQRWADMDVTSVTENADGSVDLFLVSLLGSGYTVHIDATRVG